MENRFRKGTSRGRLLSAGLGSVSVKVLSAGVGFALSLILARTIGPAGFGVYSFAYALAMVLAVCARLGVPQLVVRETAKHHAAKAWGLVRGLWRWSAVAVFLLSVVISSIVLLVVLCQPANQQARFTKILALSLVPTVALGALWAAALRGLRRVVVAQLLDTLLRPSLFLAAILAWVYLVPGRFLTPARAMALHAAAGLSALVVGGWLLLRARPRPMLAKPTPRYDAKAWALSVGPLALVAAFQMVTQYADILMLGVLRSAREVGVYRVVLQTAALVVFGLQAVNAVAMPYFARFHARGDRPALQRVVTLSARAAFLLGLPLAVAFIGLGGTVLGTLFGRAYAAGSTALAIAAGGQLLNAGMGCVGPLLNMTGYERETLRGVGLAVVLNLSLTATLIPYYGIEGAATATAIAVTVLNLVLRKAVHRRLQLEATALGPLRLQN